MMLGTMPIPICDPLWEKVPFGTNIDLPLCNYGKKLDGFGKYNL